jgi:hypothetical protein
VCDDDAKNKNNKQTNIWVLTRYITKTCSHNEKKVAHGEEGVGEGAENEYGRKRRGGLD